jgi:O-antigen/teichoic acid export membrane protein
MFAKKTGPAANGMQQLPRALKWLRLVLETGAWQAAVAAVGFASGIAIVRLLDVEQYALYTIANSLLGAMIILGDSGISSGVMAQGGAVWQDRSKLGAVIVTALRLCRFFAICAAVLGIPVAFLLLSKHGAPNVSSLAIALALVPSFILAVRNNILQTPLKLHQDLRPLQSIQLVSNVVRLFLLGGILSFAPYALAAILAATGSIGVANAYLLRRGKKYSDMAVASDRSVQTAIMQIVWRTLPGSTYYAMMGQVTIWLLSIFGTTDSIAQLGALGRLAMISSVASAVTATLLVPRFARLPNERPLLLRRLMVMMLGMLTLCLAGLVLVVLFPTQILWILGSSYSGLEADLFLVALTSAVTLFAGLCVSLSFSRGLVPPPAVLIPFSVLSYALFIALNDVSTLRGVLLMGLGTSCSMLVFNAIYLAARVGRMKPH